MPLTRLDLHSSNVRVTIVLFSWFLWSLICTTQVHEDGENATYLRGKTNLSTNGKLVGVVSKPRAVLGDICSNRSALTNVVSKSDSSDNDFKKPQLLPAKCFPKKQVQDSEK